MPGPPSTGGVGEQAPEGPAWRHLVEKTSVAMAVVSGEGLVRYASPAARRIFGDPAGQQFDGLFPADQRALVRAWLADVAGGEADRTVYFETSITSGRRERRVELRATNLLGDPAVAGIAVHAAEVTERWELAAALSERAFRDPLTNLPNRALLLDRLEQLRVGGDGSGAGFGLIFLDLDLFKAVNDRFGHHVGDEVLRAVGGRMLHEVRPEMTVARLGGDEFGVLVPNAGDEEALVVAERLLQVIGEPVTLASGEQVSVTACAGVATGRSAGAGMLRKADMAMYTAKASGRNRVVAYDGSIQRQERQRVARLQQLDELRRENADLARQVRTDPMTRMPNYLSYEERLDELDGEAREGTAYSLLFCDIDNFGAYNKAWGERAGDETLQTVARTLDQRLRKGDAIYRRGGEEFVIVLPSTDATAAAQLAERLRRSVEELRRPHDAAPGTPFVTLSIGVATFDPGRHAGARDVEDDADRAMVEAKKAGRNTVA